MGFTNLTFFMLVVLFSMGFSLALEGANADYVFCKNQKTVRTIRVEKGEGAGGCKAVYTKRGADKIIGISKYKGSCGVYVDNVRKRLEQGSWNCRNILKSDISDLNQNFSSSEAKIQ
jgi:hypothetical protein